MARRSAAARRRPSGPCARSARRAALVLVAARLDRLLGGVQPRAQLLGRRPPSRSSRISSSCSFSSNTSSSRLGGTDGVAAVPRGWRQAFDRQQVLDPRHRVAQRPIRVVEIRGSLEAGQTLGRRRVVEVVGVELAAERGSGARRSWASRSAGGAAREREVVAVAAERQDRLHCGQKCSSTGAPAPQLAHSATVRSDSNGHATMGEESCIVRLVGGGRRRRTSCRSRRSAWRWGCEHEPLGQQRGVVVERRSPSGTGSSSGRRRSWRRGPRRPRRPAAARAPTRTCS